jgi:prophage protein
MKILLSIKPVFVEEIMRGKKLFEYRKTIYKNRNISRIVVYSSSPVCRVVGEIDVKDVLCDTPERLWERTALQSGISKDCFDEYFGGKSVGYAIQIGSFSPYPRPRLLQEAYPGITPPQSFCYVEY